MRPGLRYLVSIFIGLVVTVSVVKFATTDHLLRTSLFPLYVAVSSMVIAHWQAYFALFHGDDTSPSQRKRSGVVGGVVAWTGTLLTQISILACVAGFGLLFLGMTVVVAECDESSSA
ncbi:MAG: hypothetical protein J07HQX50_01677 [Haloquadratum sp. J07HQX50]|nr:MAG: hypothetical protein J07HQX50_01677 [Haloquadratum sp. J07HQX50]